MKKTRFLIMALAAILMTTACHDDNDDYYTQLTVTVEGNDSVHIRQMQGTITMTNLNKGQSWSTSVFDGSEVVFDEIFRGAYSLSGQGTMRYADAEGQEHIASYRVASNYVEVLKHPTTITVTPILMQR
jgi:hypothetical protein